MTLPSVPIGRLVIGVVLGCTLGVLGLPRLDLSGVPSLLSAGGVQVETPLTESSPTSPLVVAEPTLMVEPTPTVEPEPTLVPVAAPVAVPRVLIDERFGAARAQWRDDPAGPAWFAGGAYRLYARQPTRFVAIGVPLPNSVGDVVLSAQFRKVGGPAGGGYGLILRDQGPAADRDGRNQDGQYLVAGVGDAGDIGIWRRDQTHWIDVVPWTHSTSVHQQMEPNSLVVTTHGAAVRFAVNGQILADLTYDGLPLTGGVGIFVGGDMNQVALEWLRIEG